MADQAASSLSNVVVAVLVARSVGVSAFGAFGLAMVVYQVLLGIVRSLVGEPFLARHSADPPAARRELVADLVGAAIMLSVVSSLAIGGTGGIAGGIAGAALVALAYVLPLVLVQDQLRFVFVVDRPGRALAIDALWLIAVIVAMLLAPSGAGVAWFIVVWGLAGGLSTAVGLVLTRAPIHRLHPWRWLTRTRRDGTRYLGDFLTAQASAQAAVVALGAISGLATLGAVRASQVFYGPLNTIHAGVYLAVVPDGARLRGDRRRLDRLIVLTAGALALLAFCWMVVGVGLPDAVGTKFFGKTWPGAEELMVPMGIAMIAGGIMSGGFLGIRSMGDPQASLRSRLLSAPGQLLLPLLGAVLGDAVGFALGAAAGRILAAGIWWWAFRGLLHSAPRDHEAIDDDEEPAVVAVALAAGGVDGD